ncbi:MAG: VWA domain-containing protein, partial [Polyangiaceae bacterium]
DRWGQEWLPWPEASRVFGQLGRDLARKTDDPRVRLEADATGGELHVRADVVGDDGRAQTFRRLTVHVAGPDGFGRDVPLEAVGAGRYAATLPLSRPGTYVAAAKDEVSGEPVGTTGAVLTAGDELRPTGSDRALLSRIAAMTGGKVRDTLAGLFDDRAARRFAYKSVVPWLAVLAATALLLMVAARRAVVPDVLAGVAARTRAYRQVSSRRRAERAAEAARVQALVAEDQRRLRDAIAARRQREGAAPRDLPALPFAPPPPAPPLAAPPPVGSPPPRGPAAGPAAPEERPLTAAERLALKRRERR